MHCSRSKTVLGFRAPGRNRLLTFRTIFVLCNDNWTEGFRHTLPAVIHASVDDLALADERPKPPCSTAAPKARFHRSANVVAALCPTVERADRLGGAIHAIGITRPVTAVRCCTQTMAVSGCTAVVLATDLMLAARRRTLMCPLSSHRHSPAAAYMSARFFRGRVECKEA